MKRHRPAAGQYTLEEQDRQYLYDDSGLTWVLKRCADCKKMAATTIGYPVEYCAECWNQRGCTG